MALLRLIAHEYEAIAGKNPVTHEGKLYNIIAQNVPMDIVNQLPEVTQVQCYLVSSIGHAVNEPQVADLRLALTEEEEGTQMAATEPRLRNIFQQHLEKISTIQEH